MWLDTFDPGYLPVKIGIMLLKKFVGCYVDACVKWPVLVRSDIELRSVLLPDELVSLWRCAYDTRHQGIIATQIISAESCIFLTLAFICILTGQMDTLSYGGSEWLVKSDAATKRWYASERIAELASTFWTSDSMVASGGGAGSVAQAVRSKPAYSVVFMYNTDVPNLFTPDILESIRQVRQTRPHRDH